MSYKKRFIELSLSKNALQFGSFKLKSERISPFFFNSGVFSDGKSLLEISELLAELIEEKKLNFDNLFGPAYKGIPLIASLSSTLEKKYNKSVNIIYDRKGEKKHGEGGEIVGNFNNGKTLIVDDVITAGTAIKNILKKLSKYNHNSTHLIVLLDREEKGSSETSASKEIENEYGLKVLSLINLSDIIEYVGSTKDFNIYKKDIEEYKEKYGS